MGNRLRGGPIRLLVTGFGPFPGVRDNPSERLVGRIAADRRLLRISAGEVRTAVLQTEWDRVRLGAPELLAAHDPDVVLHFGVHARAGGFRVERWARNRMGALPDARGRSYRACEIVRGAPRALPAGGPAGKLVSHLRGLGLPAEISTDAGRYLCNMLFYLSALHARNTGRPHAVQFVHIPPVAPPGRYAGAGALTMAELEAGAAAIIGHCMASPAMRSAGRFRSQPATEIAIACP